MVPDAGIVLLEILEEPELPDPGTDDPEPLPEAGLGEPELPDFGVEEPDPGLGAGVEPDSAALETGAGTPAAELWMAAGAGDSGVLPTGEEE